MFPRWLHIIITPEKLSTPKNEKKYFFFETIPGGTPEFDRTLFFW